MGVTTNLYDFVLVLHIMAAIIGFGGTFVAAFYGMEAGKRSGREGSIIAATTVDVTNKVPAMAIYAVPVLGILLILLSDDVWKFSQIWISLSFALYIAALGIVHAVHLPNLRKMVEIRARIDEGGPNSGLAATERKAATVGGILNLIWIAVLFLMVFKPGL